MENKMSSKPPLPKGAQDFIAAAGKQMEPEEIKDLPWLKDGVRDDVKKDISLRLYEPYLIKLKFISENSSYSQQSFARESLERAIDDKIKQLLP